MNSYLTTPNSILFYIHVIILSFYFLLTILSRQISNVNIYFSSPCGVRSLYLWLPNVFISIFLKCCWLLQKVQQEEKEKPETSVMVLIRVMILNSRVSPCLHDERQNSNSPHICLRTHTLTLQDFRSFRKNNIDWQKKLEHDYYRFYFSCAILHYLHV